jgi:queuosine precursor transporter
MFKIEKFDLLVSIYIFCIMVAELMGAKTFPILKSPFVLNGSVALFVLPLVFSINDIVMEVYGVQRARSIVRSGLVTVGLLLAYSLLATSLPPSTRFASTEAAYDQIFGLSARIAAASLTAFIIAEFTDLLVFQKIRARLGKKALWFRNNVSNIISQFLDTVVFMTLAFWAFNRPFGDNVSFLWSLILPYWLLKCTMSFLVTPFVYAGVRWLKAK